MKKVIVILAGVLISLSIFAVKLGWFTSLFSSPKDDILTYIPADTAYYLGGDSAEKVIEIISHNSSLSSFPRLSEWLKESVGDVDENDSPEARFFSYFVTQYNNATASGLADLAKMTGISLTGSYALFSDGAFSVVRINVANTKAVDVLIENAVKDSGWQYRWENIGEEKVRIWPIGEDGQQGDEAYFAVLNNEHGVVITILMSSDTLKEKQQRLGLIKPETSLATKKVVEALKEQYDYTDDMIGFIQIDRIAQAVLSPKDSRLGQDFLTYFPQQREYKQFQRELTAECRAEYTQFFNAVPRFVTGYQVLETDEDSASFTVHSALELKNKSVSLSLQNIQGHLPAHSTVLTDKIFAFGAGINSDDIEKEFSLLAKQFMGAQYNCDSLQFVQENLKYFVPQLVPDVSELLNGIKGVGVSLFDISMQADSPIPESVDFLVSIATEDSTELLKRAKNLPLSPQVTLPEDGSSVSLDLPTDIDVKAAIKGQHLVIFSGEKSTALANGLITEPIVSNGLASIAVDFYKLGELLSSDELNGLAKEISFDDCSSKYELGYMFKSLNMKAKFLMSAESNGFTAKYSGDFNKSRFKDLNVIGKYSVSFLGDDCEWDDDNQSTRDEIREDGTGLYSVKSEDSSCDVYISNYVWTKKGNTLIFNSQDQDRDSCDSEFYEAEEIDYTCYLIDQKGSDFQCFYSIDGYPTVERYTRIVD